MYPVSEEFLKALEGETVHHIRGTLTDVTGAQTEITDSLTGNIRTESQCVDDSMQFGFGGMYVGTMECSLDLPYSMKDALKGGKVVLEFGAEVSSGIEWIPLGEWNITDCPRDSGNKIRLSCSDNLSKLLVDTEARLQSFVGVISVKTLMKHVTELTGVEFAQTVEELQALTGFDLSTGFWATSYGATAWAEVKSIAQIIGGFAFANREGKIEFRRLDRTTPVLTIGADRRKNISLEEYTYTVRGVRYTDAQGYSVTYSIDGADESGAVNGFSDCLFVWETDEDTDSQYRYYLGKIAPNLQRVSFTPGTVDYYGNPALDVGDYIMITGGTAQHSGDVPFLICCNTWQFRAPQTLTACGFSEAGASGVSSGGSKESQQIRTVNITKSIVNVPLLDYPGELFSKEERTIARGGFSVRAQTCCYLEIGAVILGEDTENARISVYYDGAVQSFRPIMTVHEGEYTTLHFQVPLTAEPGTHAVEVNASGTCIAELVSSYVWGQNITEVYPEPTDTEDYIYEISGGTAEIVEYIGKSNSPEIPQYFEGAKTTKIGSLAFAYSTVENVYIPDGVTEIE